MDDKIRALTKGMSNVRIVDITNQEQLIHAINSNPPIAPNLRGHHKPFSPESELAPVYVNEMQQDYRHVGKEVIVKIVEIERKNGVMLTCIAPDGLEDRKILVWSLFLRPLGHELQAGMLLSLREPYFGQCPSGELAICVHHPSDCEIMTEESVKDQSPHSYNTWSSSKGSRGSASMPISIMPRLCGIEIRSSPLGGRGMFATQALTSGDLLLCEKPLALYTGAETSAYATSINDILSGKLINPRKLALLQHLVDKVGPNELLRKKFFDLYAGSFTTDPDLSAAGPDVFNTYTALSIIQHNAHTIFPGNTSDHHNMANKPASETKLSPTDQRPGIWLEASRMNHSCLPNASWSWIGDMFVARANRDFAQDEEITVAYVPSAYPPEKRKNILQAANGFECRCELCVADSTAVRPEGAQEAMAKAQHLQRLTANNDSRTAAKLATTLVRDALPYYPLDTYANLPCPQLAEPLFQLGKLLMHTLSTDKPDDPVFIQARDCFEACLEIGLGYKIVHYQSYYDLLAIQNSQPRPVGILALMALAELHFLLQSKHGIPACVSLKVCAKKMYGICYGEDRTFANQHQYYGCKDVEPEVRGPHGSKGKFWVERLKEAKEMAKKEGLEKRAWPKWLAES